MSYCRFVQADAYIYYDYRHGLYCCACSLMPHKIVYSDFFQMDLPEFEGFVAGRNYDLMLKHIAEHRAAGDFIPDDVDDRLIFERDCKHDYNSEGVCNLCWDKRDDGIQ